MCTVARLVVPYKTLACVWRSVNDQVHWQLWMSISTGLCRLGSAQAHISKELKAFTLFSVGIHFQGLRVLTCRKLYRLHKIPRKIHFLFLLWARV